MVPPGLSSPDASAASTMRSAIRSFTLPPGLRYSSLASTVASIPAATGPSRTSGVFPTRSATCSTNCIAPSSHPEVSGLRKAGTQRGGGRVTAGDGGRSRRMASNPAKRVAAIIGGGLLLVIGVVLLVLPGPGLLLVLSGLLIL